MDTVTVLNIPGVTRRGTPRGPQRSEETER